MSSKTIILATAVSLAISMSFIATAADNTLIINADLGKTKINKNIYGHFSEHLGRCIYEGFWVGEDSDIPNTNGIRNDVVAALKKIKVPVLRWPGGCFADEYHWMDGIGPREERPTMINHYWGGVTEDNSFGTHEFLELCRQLDCEPYINLNLGSGSVEEMSKWVEYVNSDGKSPMADLRRKNGREEPWRVKYWGVGNECWGCGGNMTPAYYSDLYRRYQTYVRTYPDAIPFKIACGPYADYSLGICPPDWMDTIMKNVGQSKMQGVDLHYYSWSGEEMGEERVGSGRSATQFTNTEWFNQLRRALRVDEYLIRESGIMDQYDPEKKIDLIVGEWGAWHEQEPGSRPRFLYQQNSLRDALVAGIHLNVFHKHADRVRMANIAQTVNVLQAMILTKEEKMILTPTYHIFDMFKVHQDAIYLPSDLDSQDYQFEDKSIPGLSASASRDESGTIHISICNLNPDESAELECTIRGAEFDAVSGTVLTSTEITAHNTFETPDVVKPATFDDFQVNGQVLNVQVPSKSVIVLELK